MRQLLGVLPRDGLPRSRSNQVVLAGALALATADDVLERRAFHSDVVSWCRHGPFLPARYGTVLTDEAVCEFERRSQRLSDQMRVLETRAEIAVIADEIPVGPQDSGREFLRARARTVDKGRLVRDALEELALAFAPYGVLSERLGSFHLALLATADEMARVGVMMDTLGQDVRDAYHLQVSGPWPAYSFTGLIMENLL